MIRNDDWLLTLDEALHTRLMAHLFPGDRDEHGAVIRAGLVETNRGTRLIARELHLAEDGVDFVPGKRGYRMLTPEFVRDQVLACRDDRLVYLTVHNHFGRDTVGFSRTDLDSHERSYPALLDISGRPVGALVLNENALAGDIWTPAGTRHEIRETVVVGRNIQRFYPETPPAPPKADQMYDRQARWFGNRGQDLLSQMKVSVVGAGGIGAPLITMLGRLGIGHIVAIDPDRVEKVNLPRMPEARRLDARIGTPKVRVARRAVRKANRKIRFDGIQASVIEPEVARQLVDSDFIFLAADSHLARMIVNAVSYQYLIPAIQLGSKIETDEEQGEVGEIRGHERLLLPGSGCLRCNRLISPTKLQEEARSEGERKQNRYIDEVPAPSVITFNSALAAQAANDFLLMMGGLIEDEAHLEYVWMRPRKRSTESQGPLPNQSACSDCGTQGSTRRARGDLDELPLPQRK